MFTDQQMTAHCGLYCGDCIRHHSRAAALAAELLAELDRVDFASYATAKAQADPARVRGVAVFAGYDQAVAVLAAVADGQCLRPCRLGGDGCAGRCDIKSCAIQAGLDGCWQCAQMATCEKLDVLLPFAGGNLRENLRIIKERGASDWVNERRGFYRWTNR